MKKWFLCLIACISLLLTAPQSNAFAEDDWNMQTMHNEAMKWPIGKSISQRGTYTFTVAKTTTYAITMTDDTARNVKLTLFDAKGNSVTEMSTSRSDYNSKQTTEIIRLAKGTYYATMYGNTSVKITPSTEIFQEIEPNNDVKQATTVPLNKQIVGRHNASMMDKDWYSFTLTKPQLVTFEMDTLYRTDHASLELSFDRHIHLYSDGSNTDFLKASVFLKAGTYTFKVDTSTTYAQNFAYSFRIQTAAMPSGVIESQLHTNEVKFGQTVQAIASTTFNMYNQADYYTFTYDGKKPLSIVTTSDAALDVSIEKWHEESNYYYAIDEVKTVKGTNRIRQTLAPDKYRLAISLPRSAVTSTRYSVQIDTALFTDVPSNHAYNAPIEQLAAKGIITGYSNGTFLPKEQILRKQVFTMLSRIDGFSLPTVREVKPFSDLAITHPNYETIAAFYKAGIIDGAKGNINPNNPLTRAQLAKILVNTFNLQLNSSVQTFKDVPSTSSSYEAIQILASNGITTGSNGYFMPNEAVTRQHFALFLSRTITSLHTTSN